MDTWTRNIGACLRHRRTTKIKENPVHTNESSQQQTLDIVELILCNIKEKSRICVVFNLFSRDNIWVHVWLCVHVCVELCRQPVQFGCCVRRSTKKLFTIPSYANTAYYHHLNAQLSWVIFIVDSLDFSEFSQYSYRNKYSQLSIHNSFTLFVRLPLFYNVLVSHAIRATQRDFVYGIFATTYMNKNTHTHFAPKTDCSRYAILSA